MSAESGTSHERPTALTFLGAGEDSHGQPVSHRHGTERLLVDCGLFQGHREWRRRNWDPLPVDPASIGGVVLTHAHLDHCEYLPVPMRTLAS